MRVGRVDHALRVGQVVAHGLLEVHVPAVAEQLDDTLGVQRDRQQSFDRVDLEPARGELRHGRERLRVRPVGLALGAAFGARVDERDDLDVGVVEVRAHVEVVDAAQADEGGADRAVEGHEAHAVRVSCCSSMVLPAGSTIQICTVCSPCSARLYSIPRASSSAIATSRSSTATQ